MEVVLMYILKVSKMFKDFFFCNCEDLNAQDTAGNTPLHIAVEYDSLEALDYLLSQ